MRSRTIQLRGGDVRAIRLVLGRDHLRVLVFDDDGARPLIQARLDRAEIARLLAALRLFRRA